MAERTRALCLAIAQIGFAPTSVAEALKCVARLTARAAAGGADLLMLPETFLSGYGNEVSTRSLSLSQDEARRALAPIAAESGLMILTGYSELAGDELYNAALLVSAGGEVLLNCRKMHLYGNFENAVYRPGEPAPVVRLSETVAAGILICFDLDFPAVAQDLVRRGADLVLVISGTTQPYAIVPRSVVPARAYENAAFVAFCNHCGVLHGNHFVGMSTVAAPDGTILATASDEEAMIFAEIDPARFADYVRTHRYLPHQRTEIFPLRPLTVTGTCHEARE